MTIYEYGDRSRPHILLIHGMWMDHTMLLPYIGDMRDEYHIITPELTGHGSDEGRFMSAKDEADKIAAWLLENGITDIDLMFSVSLGGVVAMYLAGHENEIKVKCNVTEGAALTRVRGVEWLFQLIFEGMIKHPEKLGQMYSAVPMMDEETTQGLTASIKRTDREALRNMVHTCNSFDYEGSPLSAETQKRLFFEFGSRDSHIVCRREIRKFYPGASITVRKGYGHCTFMFEHAAEYPDILRDYMKSGAEK